MAVLLGLRGRLRATVDTETQVVCQVATVVLKDSLVFGILGESAGYL